MDRRIPSLIKVWVFFDLIVLEHMEGYLLDILVIANELRQFLAIQWMYQLYRSFIFFVNRCSDQLHRCSEGSPCRHHVIRRLSIPALISDTPGCDYILSSITYLSTYLPFPYLSCFEQSARAHKRSRIFVIILRHFSQSLSGLRAGSFESGKAAFGQTLTWRVYKALVRT